MTTKALLALALLCTGCIIDDSPYGRPSGGVVIVEEGPSYPLLGDVTFVNNSSFDFYEVSLSPVGSAFWSENYLGRNPLLPGDSITVGNIECDRYDILVIDHTGTGCEIYDFDFCLADNYVYIDDLDMTGANCF